MELIVNIFLNIRLFIYLKLNPSKFKDYKSNKFKQGYELTFMDEFNDAYLDTKKWNTAPYSGEKYHPNNLNVFYTQNGGYKLSGGCIHLQASNTPTLYDNIIFPYSICLLDNSKSFQQQYGYFEIRCKVPKSLASWPAFWLVSKHSWPPEIDIFEFNTSKYKDKAFASNVHWGMDKTTNKTFNKPIKHNVYKASEYFGVYAVKWTDKYIKFYYNDLLIRKVTKNVDQFKYPMHLIVNNGITLGKDSKIDKANFPNYFIVDYVRAYKILYEV